MARLYRPRRAMPGRLTTHILDTAHGTPAAGVSVELYRLVAEGPRLLLQVVTNRDGRCDGPLLEGEALQAGRYRLLFRAGDYFRAQGVALPDPPFLDEVVIDFGVADATAHYHVPLLLSPWSYATYRGS
jgi:5-hydroxyisourate hydrolase